LVIQRQMDGTGEHNIKWNKWGLER
jgi:hypothetical protein